MKKVVLFSSIIFSLSLSYGVEEKVKFSPEEYRGWYHVKSMVIFDKKHPLYNPFWGIHHVYVNEKGLKTIKINGKRKFPDGTVIAIVFYEHISVDNNTAFVEGKKRIEAFMIKDSKKFKSTGGWGFFAYDSKGRNLVKNMVKDCFSCHAKAKKLDYVFSVWTK